jgi:hypothetical protein
MKRHLLVAISAHGYGHCAQTSALINPLVEQQPDIDLTLYTALPRAYLNTRFKVPFTHIDDNCDLGMLMDSAIDVSREASAQAYADYHAHWDLHLANTMRKLESLSPDLIFANIPYTILAAAARLNIPAIACCSLNWADVYRHYCHHRAEASEIHQTIFEAYRDCDLFLRLTPGMPMAELANVKPIGPVAYFGRNRREEINACFDIDPAHRIVLIGMGGMELDLSFEDWPKRDGVIWLIPKRWGIRRTDCLISEEIGLSFIDQLRSSDVLITKPGYGSYTEAACNATAVLYVPRLDWPEAPFLDRWLAENARSRAIRREAIMEGEIEDELSQLLAQPQPQPPKPSGIIEARQSLLSHLYR